MPLSKIEQSSVNSNVAGTGPAFSAVSAGQSLSSSTFTKITFPTASYNLGSCYNTGTSTFTPNVAGYYLIQTNVGVSGSSSLTRVQIRANHSSGAQLLGDYPSNQLNVGGSIVLYFNGTTDSVYIDAYIVASSVVIDSSVTYTRFSATMLRAA